MRSVRSRHSLRRYVHFSNSIAKANLALVSLKGPAPSFQLQVKKIVVAVAVGSRAEFMTVLRWFHFIPHSLGATYARLRPRAPRSPVQIVSTKGPKQGVVAATSARDGSRARRRRRLTKAARSASKGHSRIVVRSTVLHDKVSDIGWHLRV